jgi:hypothetical protein
MNTGSSRRLQVFESVALQKYIAKNKKREGEKTNEKNRYIGGSAHVTAGGKCNGGSVRKNT